MSYTKGSGTAAEQRKNVVSYDTVLETMHRISVAADFKGEILSGVSRVQLAAACIGIAASMLQIENSYVDEKQDIDSIIDSFVTPIFRQMYEQSAYFHAKRQEEEDE